MRFDNYQKKNKFVTFSWLLIKLPDRFSVVKKRVSPFMENTLKIYRFLIYSSYCWWKVGNSASFISLCVISNYKIMIQGRCSKTLMLRSHQQTRLMMIVLRKMSYASHSGHNRLNYATINQSHYLWGQIKYTTHKKEEKENIDATHKSEKLLCLTGLIYF